MFDERKKIQQIYAVTGIIENINSTSKKNINKFIIIKGFFKARPGLIALILKHPFISQLFLVSIIHLHFKYEIKKSTIYSDDLPSGTAFDVIK